MSDDARIFAITLPGLETTLAEEARAIGVNWSFTPVLDINAAFRSAIVATRSFGSDLATIARHGLIHIETPVSYTHLTLPTIYSV